MTDIDDTISLIAGKMERVIQVAEGYKADNERLKRQIDELSGQLYVKKQEIEVLESKFQSLKFAKTLISSGDIKDVKFKVNQMVREIDKCIALLNR
jgi:predicted RNase H-like nuclease (RuvC/YqgF family)